MAHDIDPSITLAEIMRPKDQQDEFTAKLIKDSEGIIIGAKKLPDGSYAAIMKLAFTEAICLGVDAWGGVEKRYCFHPSNFNDMLLAFYRLKSQHDEPSGWISARPKPYPHQYPTIESAPKDGTYIRAFNFDQFGCIQWGRTAAFQNGWVEVDSTNDGQPIDPTHWAPYV